MSFAAMRKWVSIGVAAAVATLTSANAVVLNNENKVSLPLSGGVTLVLFGAADNPKQYYYLPPQIRLSNRPDGVPEFLFLKYVTEESEEQGGVSGALLHMLMEWGLTPEQKTEAETLLQAKVPDAELMGAAQMMAGADESAGFQIISATLSDKTLAPVLEKTQNAPLIEGGKVAAAARLQKYGAQLLDATFSGTSSVTDLSVTLNMAYETQLPAAKGKIVVDWSKLEQNSETYRADYTREKSGTTETSDCFIIFCASSSRPEYSYTYNEVRNQFDYLVEQKVITFDFEETYSDDRVTAIRDAFVQVFINMMTDPADAEGPPPPPAEEEKEQSPDIRTGNSYQYRQSSFSQSFQRKRQVFDLNYKLTVRWPFQVTGNLLSWYDAAKDYEGTVGSVALNDPFFSHRSINLLLDLDSEEMFNSIVNLVDVEIRKKRTDGRDFTSSVTFDRETIKKDGVLRTVTYARGEDTNSDVFEYKTQWSLRGGARWPATPQWVKGDWQGVSISPPIAPRTIELMGDIGEMEESGVVRVTAQVRYPQLGVEKEENIQLPITGDGLASKTVFMDRDAPGYAYRLVINHKRHGKLALPWNGRRTDDFIYAQIPEELLSEDPTAIVKAKTAAGEAVNKVVDRVLSEMDGLE